MPTDGQRRVQEFEAWATKIYGFTDAEYEAAWDEDYEYYMHDDLSKYWPPFQHAWLARDAEVRKLRKLVDHAKRIFQNAEVRSGYCVCGDTPERHGLYAEACQYTDQGQWESDLWLKREAAIARAEGGAE